MDRAFQLLLACAEWPRGESRNIAIRNAASALDGRWEQFVVQVTRHRMAPIALDGLTCAGIQAPQEIRGQAHLCAAHSLVLAAEGGA